MMQPLRPFLPSRARGGVLRFTPSSLALLLALGVSTGCGKKDEPAADAKAADAKAADAKVADAKPTDAAGTTPTATAPGAPGLIAPALEHGTVLGHFMLPNPSAAIKDVKEQLTPAPMAGMVDENFLRLMGANQLGERKGIAENLDLSKPLGCAFISPKAAASPVACVMGYKGGVEALVKDLGDEGKAKDAKGHAALYDIAGQTVILEAMGDAVAVFTDEAVFAQTKDYLATNLVGRAASVKTDVEIVVYPTDIAKEYDKELQGFVELMDATSDLTPFDSIDQPKVKKMLATMMAFNKDQNAQTIAFIKDMKELALSMSVEEVGFVTRVAVFANEGSLLAKSMQGAAGRGVPPKVLQGLPASTMLAVGQTMDWKYARENPQAQRAFEMLAKVYADLTDKDAAAVQQQLLAFYDEVGPVYTGVAALSFAYEPGTVGGMITSSQAADIAKANELWTRFTTEFTADAILGAEASKYVTWSFATGAATVEGVSVDRWTIEAGEAIREDMLADIAKDPEAKALVDKLGGPKLVIDRFAADDRVFIVVAPGANETYDKAAILAAGGSGDLAADAGLQRIVARNPGSNAIVAFNVKQILAYVGSLAPELKATAPQLGDGSIGTDHGDVYFAFTTTGTTQTGEVVIAQSLINQLRALAN